MDENSNKTVHWEETIEISGYTVHVRYAVESPPDVLEQIENSLLQNFMSP